MEVPRPCPQIAHDLLGATQKQSKQANMKSLYIYISGNSPKRDQSSLLGGGRGWWAAGRGDTGIKIGKAEAFS